MRREIYNRFLKFWNENPQVYERLRELALELKRRGVRKYSIKGLFEVLRWEHALETKGDTFKLNDHYTAWYARALMKNEPELKEFFNTRRGK